MQLSTLILRYLEFFSTCLEIPVHVLQAIIQGISGPEKLHINHKRLGLSGA